MSCAPVFLELEFRFRALANARVGAAFVTRSQHSCGVLSAPSLYTVSFSFDKAQERLFESTRASRSIIH